MNPTELPPGLEARCRMALAAKDAALQVDDEDAGNPLAQVLLLAAQQELRDCVTVLSEFSLTKRETT